MMTREQEIQYIQGAKKRHDATLRRLLRVPIIRSIVHVPMNERKRAKTVRTKIEAPQQADA